MRVAATTTIGASPEQVWSFIANVENGPRWQESAVWTRVITPGPAHVGSEAEHLGKWLWMRIRTNGAITTFEPPRRLAYEIRSRLTPQPSIMTYEVEPDSRGSKLTLSNQAAFGGWMRPFEPLLRRSVQGMFERDVVRLKGVIEAEVKTGAPSPAGA
jgi:uncharacterized protein YndB with AHSA1/START domain